MRLPVLRTPLVLALVILLAGGCIGGAEVIVTPTAPPSTVSTPAPASTAAPTTISASIPTSTPVPTPTPAPTSTPSPIPTPSPSPVSTATATPTAVPAASISGQRAMQHVRYLSEAIGSRPAGSLKERAAADYISEQLRSYGYTVQRQSFAFPYFIDRGSQLEVLGAQPEDMHPLTLGLSGAGQVEGPVVDVGVARTGELPPGGLAGRIALVQRGEITFDEKVANVARAGAEAAIIYNNAPGNFRGRLSNLASIPVVSIAQDEGNRLAQALSASAVSVRLSVDATSEERHGENVIASKQGTGTGVVVFGAHYDSVEAGPGANDNASGTAVLLELARLAQAGPLTQRFIAFSAEELGLYGSRYYVSTLTQQERQQVRAMVSVDMVGVGDRIRFGGSQAIVDAGLAIAGAQGDEALALTGVESGGSDHASFIAAGIPAALFHITVGNDLDPRYHTAEDKASFVDPDNLEKMMRICQAFTARLAQGL